MPRMHRSHRVAGALVGAAVGDALGAPFAGSPPGEFSRRFPVPARGVHTEMCGDPPGRFTEEFGAALVVATSLVEGGAPAVESPVQAIPTAIAAARDRRSRGHQGPEGHETADLAETLRRSLDGEDVPEALRGASGFAEVMRRAVDAGGNTSTRAAVAGAVAGAVFGMAGIPMRWSSVVHGSAAARIWRLDDLQELAAALDGRAAPPYDPGVIPRIGPREVLPGIWAGNLDGARYSDTDFAVISLCRLGEPFGHEVQRMAYLADDEFNTELDVVLEDVLSDMAALRAEGRRLLVHCHGGASRTGLILRAWLRRTEGLSADEATAEVASRWPYLGLWNASFTAALERMS